MNPLQAIRFYPEYRIDANCRPYFDLIAAVTTDYGEHRSVIGNYDTLEAVSAEIDRLREIVGDRDA